MIGGQRAPRLGEQRELERPLCGERNPDSMIPGPESWCCLLIRHDGEHTSRRGDQWAQKRELTPIERVPERRR